MPRANKWFDSRPEMLIFWTTFASLSEVLLFWHFSDIDTLVSEDSVPLIIFRTRMFIFNITHHVPFIHHFPPFTIHIGYIILPDGFRFQSCFSGTCPNKTRKCLKKHSNFSMCLAESVQNQMYWLYGKTINLERPCDLVVALHSFHSITDHRMMRRP